MTAKNPHAPEPDFPTDSPTTNIDAGLEPVPTERDLRNDDINSNLPPTPKEEISSPDMDIESLDDPATRDTIRSPEMSDFNVPGEIDIEALGENDLDEVLPPDARLDPIEE